MFMKTETAFRVRWGAIMNIQAPLVSSDSIQSVCEKKDIKSSFEKIDAYITFL